MNFKFQNKNKLREKVRKLDKKILDYKLWFFRKKKNWQLELNNYNNIAKKKGILLIEALLWSYIQQKQQKLK